MLIGLLNTFRKISKIILLHFSTFSKNQSIEITNFTYLVKIIVYLLFRYKDVRKMIDRYLCVCLCVRIEVHYSLDHFKFSVTHVTWMVFKH